MDPKELIRKLASRVSKLEKETVALRAQLVTVAPLPSWCDEMLFSQHGVPNPNIPFLCELNTRTFNALNNLTTSYNNKTPFIPVVKTVRGLVGLSHNRLSNVRKFGRKSYRELIAAVVSYGVPWPKEGLGGSV